MTIRAGSQAVLDHPGTIGLTSPFSATPRTSAAVILLVPRHGSYPGEHSDPRTHSRNNPSDGTAKLNYMPDCARHPDY